MPTSASSPAWPSPSREPGQYLSRRSSRYALILLAVTATIGLSALGYLAASDAKDDAMPVWTVTVTGGETVTLGNSGTLPLYESDP